MYFYLEWINKRPSIIKIQNEKPSTINFRNTFKIKGSEEEIIICGNISNQFREYYPSPKKIYKNNQYLQSHLQKCVRRMQTYKSIKTAKHLIDLDLTTFIRRLPIIMLEDVCIHESISVIIWLMISIHKGFRIRCEMIKWLLGVVYYLSTEEKKDNYLNKDREETDFTIDHQLKDILYPLRYRKAYGGMKGDMNMIEYYIHELTNLRLKPTTDKITLIKLTMDPLPYKEWVYQANDFHCNKSIIPRIKNHFPKYPEEYIQRLIWYFSSSTNLRIKDDIEHPKQMIKDWEKIKGTVKRIQKTCKYY